MGCVQVNADDLTALAESLKANGQILNIVVEEAFDGSYILHDGERRTRAARMAGWSHIRATVLPANQTNPMGLLIRALVANVQRTDLNPVEEAQAYARMVATGLSAAEICRRTGISPNRVYGRLLLASLSPTVQQLIVERRLPADRAVADAILSLPAEMRDQFAATMASRPGLTIKAIVNAAKRARALAAEAATQPETITPPDHRSRISSAPPTGWDAAAQLGHQPPWSRIAAAAKAVCITCPLADVAGSETCKECPLVSFLSKLEM
jgi:ParB family chromosome partitioning protein